MAGRNPKLTKEIEAAIVEAIKAGSYASVAAQVAGIGESTYYRWMSIGKQAARDFDSSAREDVTMALDEWNKLDDWERRLTIESTFQQLLQGLDEYGNPVGDVMVTFTRRVDPDQPYREFWESVKKADSHAEARNLTLIAKAAEKDWHAAAWILERRHPDRWRRRDTVYNEEPPPVSKTDRILENDRARELAAELEELIADGVIDAEEAENG